LVNGPVVIGYIHGGWVRAEFLTSMLNACSGPKASQAVGGAISTTAGPLIALARNVLVGQFLEGPFEWLLFIDTDILFTEDAPDRLLASALADDLPVVSAMYHVFEQDKKIPAVYLNMAEPPVLDLQAAEIRPGAGTVRVTATGAGFLLINRKVLEEIRERSDGEHCWFREATIEGRDIGEDVSFCLRVAMAGYSVHVNTDVQVGHMKTALLGEVN